MLTRAERWKTLLESALPAAASAAPTYAASSITRLIGSIKLGISVSGVPLTAQVPTVEVRIVRRTSFLPTWHIMVLPTVTFLLRGWPICRRAILAPQS